MHTPMSQAGVGAGADNYGGDYSHRSSDVEGGYGHDDDEQELTRLMMQRGGEAPLTKRTAQVRYS